MDTLHLLLRFLHFVGLAALLGGFLTQIGASGKRATAAMRHGALAQLLTGVVLVGLNEPDVNHAKVGLKLLLLLAVLLLVWRARGRTLPSGTFNAAGALSALVVAVAVFWR